MSKPLRFSSISYSPGTWRDFRLTVWGGANDSLGAFGGESMAPLPPPPGSASDPEMKTYQQSQELVQVIRWLSSLSSTTLGLETNGITLPCRPSRTTKWSVPAWVETVLVFTVTDGRSQIRLVINISSCQLCQVVKCQPGPGQVVKKMYDLHRIKNATCRREDE